MKEQEWKEKIESYDDRRDIAIPGDATSTLAFCAEQFASLAATAIAAHGNFFVALSGGGTPKTIFQLLASSAYRDRVDWSRVQLYWSDERCVPPNHPDSNYNMAMEAGFKTLSIPQKNIFRMPAEGDVEEEAKAYETLIKNNIPQGSFDLIMLGMGEDGHTASLFPKTHGLHSGNRLVIANFVPQKNVWRMTLTFECINAAHAINVYVIGKSKASMLRHVLTTPYDPDTLPIQAVGTRIHKALWIVDADAASQLY